MTNCVHECGRENLTEDIIISNNNQFKCLLWEKWEGAFELSRSRSFPFLSIFPLFSSSSSFFLHINRAVIFLKPTTQFPLWILLLCREQITVKIHRKFVEILFLADFMDNSYSVRQLQYQFTHLNCTLLCIVHAVAFVDYVVVFWSQIFE